MSEYCSITSQIVDSHGQSGDIGLEADNRVALPTRLVSANGPFGEGEVQSSKVVDMLDRIQELLIRQRGPKSRGFRVSRVGESVV